MEVSPESHVLSSPTRKNLHRRSRSPESESKRRKHHHRHHSDRHHRHRHRSRKEKKEENPEDGDDMIRNERYQVAEDGEIEEGEILEEGEIVSDHDTRFLHIQAVPDKNHNYSDNATEHKVLDNHLDSASPETLPNNCGIDSKKIEAIPRWVDDKTKRKSSTTLAVIDVLNDVNTKRKQSRVDAVAVVDDDGDRSRVRSVTPFSRDSTDVKNKAWDEDIEVTSDHFRRRKKNNEKNQRDRSRSREIDYDRRNHSSNLEIDKHRHAEHGVREDEYIDHIRQTKKARAAHRERDRSVSHSRHDREDLRHTNNDRDIDKSREYRKERERSSSISSRKEYDTRKMERDGGKHRDMEKLRDVSRDRYREKDRSRRGRDMDSYDRDRGRCIDRDRENGRRSDRDNRGMHNDSRHPKYYECDRQRERIRSNEIRSATNDLDRKGETLREEDEDDYQEKIEHQLANQEEEELERIKEESRKRKQAILEKYKQQHLQHTVSVSPAVNGELALGDTKECSDTKHDNSDMKEEFPNGYAIDPSFTVEKSSIDNGVPIHEKGSGVGGLGEGSPKSERSADMFCDDIFGESPVGIRKTGKTDALQIEKSGLHDNWDDADGYYSYRFGEILDGRYEVIAAHGKGVFSTVVRAKDLKSAPGEPEEVAIKIIRNNETMYKAGQEELKILGKLAATDPEDKRHCVRFLSTFKYRNHLCLVFESLHMNLREVLKKFGRNIGLKLTAVRTYAKQLFIALKHLRNCGVLHCDIKPDNMLVNEGKNILKLCDFGNAMSAGKNEPTPYLVSRFYRAPEIILGLEYDHPLDMWSVGCCLYELYCGKVLFPGPSNNDMLRLHMELKGSFPKKMLRKALFTSQHFDQDLNFLATEEDPVTRKPIRRLLLNIKPKDISTLISSSPGEDPKMTANFKDLLERIFVLDPEKRLTVSQALSHPFITGK